MSEGKPRRPIAAVGAVIADTAGAVLLVRRGQPPRDGEWSIPGGKVEWGETLDAAIRREVREETGLEITTPIQMEAIDSLIGEAGAVAYHHVLIDFAARAVGGRLQAGDDVTDARFVAPAALGDYPMWPETRRIIAKALALLEDT